MKILFWATAAGYAFGVISTYALVYGAWLVEREKLSVFDLLAPLIWPLLILYVVLDNEALAISDSIKSRRRKLVKKEE